MFAGNAQSSFTYDPNSNRLSSVNKVTSDTDLDGDFDQLDKAATTAQSLAIGAGSNKLLGFSQTLTTTKGTQTLATSSQQVNYQLDAAGNLTSDGLHSFDYDSTNRHQQTTVSKDGEASKITYLHNALGQRVFKSEPQTAQTLPNEAVLGGPFTNWLKRNFSWMYARARINVTLGDSYVYADGCAGGLPSYAMLGEYGNGGASSTGRTEYLWLPTDNGQAIPVGIYRGSRFYAVHADHLNTPRLIHDDSNKAVWQWPYSAFGDNKPIGILKATTNPANAFTQDSTTNARLQATNAAITYNPRFPGQYADSESGLFQNGFRSLIASQGRYSQSDPMGLGGGFSRFGYVEGNALKFVDPIGLSKKDVFGIEQKFHTTIENLISQRLRRLGGGTINGVFNNAERYWFRPEMYDCADQSVKLVENLNSKKYDDKWRFEMIGQPPHYKAQATSSNPVDPILVFDPWRNQYEIQYKGVSK